MTLTLVSASGIFYLLSAVHSFGAFQAKRDLAHERRTQQAMKAAMEALEAGRG